MNIQSIAVVCFVFAMLLMLPACASGTKHFPVPLPDTDLKVVPGECGPEFKGKAKATTDVAIGDTGWRWAQTTTADNRVYRPCKPPQDAPASQPAAGEGAEQ